MIIFRKSTWKLTLKISNINVNIVIRLFHKVMILRGMLWHNWNKPYKCSHYWKAFLENDNLLKHILTRTRAWEEVIQMQYLNEHTLISHINVKIVRQIFHKVLTLWSILGHTMKWNHTIWAIVKDLLGWFSFEKALEDTRWWETISK